MHLQSDLPHYCCFGETLLTPSQLVDTSKIYNIYVGLPKLRSWLSYVQTIVRSVSIGDVLQHEWEVKSREDHHVVAVAIDGLLLLRFGVLFSNLL